jgi:capsular polysaccharide biosynthesis protein
MEQTHLHQPSEDKFASVAIVTIVCFIVAAIVTFIVIQSK